MTIDESGERIYPIDSKKRQRSVQALFDAKKAKNTASGRTALETGNFKPFESFSKDSFDNLFVLEVEPDQKTKDEISKRVTGPMKKIAQDLGINGLLVGGEGDQSPHITVHVGRFEGISLEEKTKIVDWLKGDVPGSSSHLKPITEILTGTQLTMDTIVCSGRDTYLCAGTVDDRQGVIYRARQVFDKAMNKAQERLSRTNPNAKIGPHYPRFDDICHSTMARFTQLVEPSKLVAFNQQVQELVGKNLENDPIVFNIEASNLLIATEGVERRKPELLK